MADIKTNYVKQNSGNFVAFNLRIDEDLMSIVKLKAFEEKKSATLIIAEAIKEKFAVNE